MYQSVIDFHRISKAITFSIEAVKNEADSSPQAIEDLYRAKGELEQALTFSLSTFPKN